MVRPDLFNVLHDPAISVVLFRLFIGECYELEKEMWTKENCRS